MREHIVVALAVLVGISVDSAPQFNLRDAHYVFSSGIGKHFESQRLTPTRVVQEIEIPPKETKEKGLTEPVAEEVPSLLEYDEAYTLSPLEEDITEMPLSDSLTESKTIIEQEPLSIMEAPLASDPAEEPSVKEAPMETLEKQTPVETKTESQSTPEQAEPSESLFLDPIVQDENLWRKAAYNLANNPRLLLWLSSINSERPIMSEWPSQEPVNDPAAQMSENIPADDAVIQEEQPQIEQTLQPESPPQQQPEPLEQQHKPQQDQPEPQLEMQPEPQHEHLSEPQQEQLLEPEPQLEQLSEPQPQQEQLLEPQPQQEQLPEPREEIKQEPEMLIEEILQEEQIFDEMIEPATEEPTIIEETTMQNEEMFIEPNNDQQPEVASPPQAQEEPLMRAQKDHIFGQKVGATKRPIVNDQVKIEKESVKRAQEKKLQLTTRGRLHLRKSKKEKPSRRVLIKKAKSLDNQRLRQPSQTTSHFIRQSVFPSFSYSIRHVPVHPSSSRFFRA